MKRKQCYSFRVLSNRPLNEPYYTAYVPVLVQKSYEKTYKQRCTVLSLISYRRNGRHNLIDKSETECQELQTVIVYELHIFEKSARSILGCGSLYGNS